MYILGININNITKTEALQKINGFLTDGRQHWIATVNPEIILKTREDEGYRDILNKADLRVADGVGVVLASWFLGIKLKERIAGVNLVYDILGNLKKEWRMRVMIIGAEEDSRRKAGERLKKLFPSIDLRVSDFTVDFDGSCHPARLAEASAKREWSPRRRRDGVARRASELRREESHNTEILREVYPVFDSEVAPFHGLRARQGLERQTRGEQSQKVQSDAMNSQEVLLRLNKEIKDFRPAILFVAFGAPYQEKWIYENLKLFLTVKLAIGIGGAIDMISRKLPRAPLFMRRIGLEWLWRLILEPKRAGRIFNAVIVFMFLVLKSMFTKKHF